MPACSILRYSNLIIVTELRRRWMLPCNGFNVSCEEVVVTVVEVAKQKKRRKRKEKRVRWRLRLSIDFGISKSVLVSEDSWNVFIVIKAEQPNNCNCSTVRRDQGCCVSEIDVEGDGSALAEMGTPGNGCPQPNCSTYTRKLWESTRSQRHTSTQSYLDYPNKERITNPPVLFWTPFLLMHLRGATTIAAPSFSHNDRWPRQFFGLPIPIFIVGIIKYGERVWALFQASKMGMEFQSSDKGSQLEMGSLKKSAFFEGCQIAVQLQTLLEQFKWGHEDKWKLIADVWLDMLTYVAAQCSWKEHVRPLQQGEELLTRVALLMAHLGLSKNIQKVPLPKRLQEVQYEPTFYWDRLNRLPSYWT
ncbi:hypothetical protein Gohar_021241 [Gossypium harknessii]|uniref:DUF4220 domain-containing protein n=1 Tax=Gossypium harknessii TaxID=34285 RepID=A0A7J9IDE3_9ROSI|nr:hypothetical protein [Gossypium harknessii]